MAALKHTPAPGLTIRNAASARGVAAAPPRGLSFIPLPAHPLPVCLPRSQSLRAAWRTLRKAVALLGAHDPFRMAGATAFFTTFGLPAMLIIVVRTLGIFLNRRTVGRQLGDVLRTVLGPDSVDAIRQAIRSFSALQSGYLLSAGIFLFLLFVATTLFKVIRASINEIWRVRSRRPANLGDMLQSRAIAVAVMLLGGVLFMTTHLVDSVQHQYLAAALPDNTSGPGRALNILVVLLVSTVWFYAVFMALPDGRPSRKVTLGGAFITAVLFSIGKIVLRVLMSPGRVAGFYGASGAVVLVLLFVFYASIILYFGAALIRAWSEAVGKPIVPRRHAEKYKAVAEELG